MSEIVPIDTFLEKLFILPNGDLIELHPHQREILRAAFTPDGNGRLKYRQVVYSCPKKSGKSQIGACVASWFAFSGIGEKNGEIYACANDLEQAQGRVYRALKRSIEMSDVLRHECTKITDKNGIEVSNGTMISALSGDYAGAAGANPELSLFDELWGFTSESSKRLYEEMTPVPTRKNSLRVITTYAGFEAESELLETIYKEVVRPEYRIDLGSYMNYVTGEVTPLPVYVKGDSFVYWDHECRMPWQTREFMEDARNQPGFRLSAYLRLYENRWVGAEEGLDMDDWDRCVDISHSRGYRACVPPDTSMPLAAAVDASTVKDRTAVSTAFKQDGRLWLGPRQTWQPSKENPLIFEETIEKYILELYSRYFLTVVFYDPWQMESTAQRLRSRGVNMIAYPQTQPNTIVMTEFLIDKLRNGHFMMYPDTELRAEAASISVKEVPGRGRRFIKTTAGKKIDSLIATAMAALAAEYHCPDMQSMRDQIFAVRLKKRG